MFELVKFKKEHLQCMVDQPENLYLKEWLSNGHADEMEAQRSSFTGLVKGKPAVCGGVVELWRDRGCIWSVFNTDFRTNFLPVFRGVKHFLDRFPCKRLEMAIACQNDSAVRRAKLLGFEVEALRARSYLPDGSDCVILSKVVG